MWSRPGRTCLARRIPVLCFRLDCGSKGIQFIQFENLILELRCSHYKGWYIISGLNGLVISSPKLSEYEKLNFGEGIQNTMGDQKDT